MKHWKLKFRIFICLNSIVFPALAHGPDWAYYLMYAGLFLGFILLLWATWKGIIFIVIPLLQKVIGKN